MEMFWVARQGGISDFIFDRTGIVACCCHLACGDVQAGWQSAE
jgi:hypothetical protein